MNFGKVIREEWLISFDRDEPGDSYASVFANKADTDNLWNNAVGLYVDDVMVGGYVSVVENSITNFKLLHVFSRFRGNDYGTELLMHSFNKGKKESDYFKVTSEMTALKFYDRLGFKFWGEHDYGPCYLILGKYNAYGTLTYTLDSFMRDLMLTKYKIKGEIPTCALSLDQLVEKNSLILQS